MSYTLSYAQGGLPAAADYIRSKGRNEDTQLVHMTPGEVQALQQMAQNHGGSLTINPHTGLPEAGWLGNILKVAAPMALSFVPGVGPLAASIGGAFGASGALASGIGMGLLTGGITTLATGSLKQGLGAGLTSGLMTGVGQSMAAGKVDPTAVKTTTAAQAANAANATNAANAANTAVNTGLNVQGSYPAMLASPQTAAAALPVQTTAAAPGLFDKAYNSFSNLSTPAKLGIGAAGLGAISAMSQPKFKPAPIDKGNIRPYTYSANQVTPFPNPMAQGQQVPMYNAMGNPNLDTAERRYYNPSYEAQPMIAAAGGGLMQASPLMGQNMYPQSQQDHTNFATPTQMPTSAEVVSSDYDAMTAPYSGQEMPRMASGGIAIPQANNEYSYNPDTRQYSQQNPSLQSLSGLSGYDNNSMGNINQVNPGVFRNLFDLLKNQSGIGQQNYTYDPVNQKYTKMAEGGDITSGYQGYGQKDQVGRNPLDLIKALSAQQTPQQPATTVIRQAQGGLSGLGSYSDGGRMLKGPGDGMSDNIPAVIGHKQPARLADGEFVVPADVVSHLGNGSTDAGAKRLYSMMDKVRQARTGTKKQGKQIKADKYLPA